MYRRGPTHREPRPKEPDWEYWKDIPAPELWQLVALSCNLEPREYSPPYSHRIDEKPEDDSPKFNDRYDIALANIDDFKPKKKYAELGAWKIPTGQFVEWAKPRVKFQPMLHEFEALGEKPPRKASTPTPAHADAIKARAHGKTARAAALKAKVIQLAQAHKSKDPAATHAIIAQHVRHQMAFEDGMKQLALSTIRQYRKGKV